MIMLLSILLAAVAPGSVAIALESPGIVDATVCDLVQRPLEFENKHVRVRGTVQAGPEFFGLVYDSCPSTDRTSGSIWLDLAGGADILKYDRGWPSQRFLQAARSGQLKGDGPHLPWKIPAPVAPLDQEQLRGLYRALESEHTGRVQVVITGRFDSAEGGLLTKTRQGDFSFVAAFGHLGCCSAQIVLERIELASEAK